MFPHHEMLSNCKAIRIPFMGICGEVFDSKVEIICTLNVTNNTINIIYTK